MTAFDLRFCDEGAWMEGESKGRADPYGMTNKRASRQAKTNARKNERNELRVMSHE